MPAANKTQRNVQALDLFKRFLPFIRTHAEAWEVPVFVAFLEAIQSLTNERGKVPATLVISLGNAVIRRLCSAQIHGRGLPEFDRLFEQWLWDTGNYSGFNDNYWLEWGYVNWRAAGKPADKERFQSTHPYNRFFYGGASESVSEQCAAIAKAGFIEVAV